MNKFKQVVGLATSTLLVGIVPSFATVAAVPAPEIGGTTLGMILAGGIAFYIRNRRQR
jgi:hypothetical protein